MYWTLELASKMEDAPWPATKDELLEWAMRVGLQQEVIENLSEIEDEGEIYERIEDIAKVIGVDSLAYLSIDAAHKLAQTDCEFCDGCFTGNYPIPAPTQVYKNKFEEKISK